MIGAKHSKSKLTTGFDFVRLERTLQRWLARIPMIVKPPRTLTLNRPSDLCIKKSYNKTLHTKHEANKKVDLRPCQLLDPASRSLLTQLGPHSMSGQRHRGSHHGQKGPTNSFRASPLLRCCWNVNPGKPPPPGGC